MAASGAPEAPKMPDTYCIQCGIRLSHPGLWKGLPTHINPHNDRGPYCSMCYEFLYPEDGKWTFGKGVTIPENSDFIANLPVEEPTTGEFRTEYPCVFKKKKQWPIVLFWITIGIIIGVLLMVYGI